MAVTKSYPYCPHSPCNAQRKFLHPVKGATLPRERARNLVNQNRSSQSTTSDDCTLRLAHCYIVRNDDKPKKGGSVWMVGAISFLCQPEIENISCVIPISRCEDGLRIPIPEGRT
jgi:hypothetical protein